MNIVIVESPAKAKTINKYLGSSYEVLASFGHVRDLPAKNGSVDPDANFQMIWEVDPKAAGRLNDIAKALKGADKLILATDPDREGEAISWHVLEVLKEKRALKDQKIERVVFNAITKQAITDAMKSPRQIDGWATVASAFAGLTIYRTEQLQGLRYDNATEDCEHVSLHRALAAQGSRLVLDPSLLLLAGRQGHHRLPARLQTAVAVDAPGRA